MVLCEYIKIRYIMIFLLIFGHLFGDKFLQRAIYIGIVHLDWLKRKKLKQRHISKDALYAQESPANTSESYVPLECDENVKRT